MPLMVWAVGFGVQKERNRKREINCERENSKSILASPRKTEQEGDDVNMQTERKEKEGGSRGCVINSWSSAERPVAHLFQE